MMLAVSSFGLVAAGGCGFGGAGELEGEVRVGRVEERMRE